MTATGAVYGTGGCAYCLSQGYAVGADPRTWLIVDGALYLNRRYARWRWRESMAELLEPAERHWQTISGWMGVRLTGLKIGV